MCIIFAILIGRGVERRENNYICFAWPAWAIWNLVLTPFSPHLHFLKTNSQKNHTHLEARGICTYVRNPITWELKQEDSNSMTAWATMQPCHTKEQQ